MSDPRMISAGEAREVLAGIKSGPQRRAVGTEQIVDLAHTVVEQAAQIERLQEDLHRADKRGDMTLHREYRLVHIRGTSIENPTPITDLTEARAALQEQKDLYHELGMGEDADDWFIETRRVSRWTRRTEDD